MSILISGVRLPFDRSDAEAIELALKQAGLQNISLQAEVYRCSMDARHGKIDKVYSICVRGVENEQRFVQCCNKPSVRFKPEIPLQIILGKSKLVHRPIVVGMGPAGLFAAYFLAKYGYHPLVIERGDAIDARDQAVARFSSDGKFDAVSNIQFGEGGAGAYSDGKLTTRIHDPLCEEVLKILTQHGAPQEIRFQAKPHIGTDMLKNVVYSMRKKIEQLGGEVYFRTPLINVKVKHNLLQAVCLEDEEIPCERAILAIGHSARDTFESLQSNIYMEAKAFSVGVRIEHLQKEIDTMQYGKFAGEFALPPAEYTLSHRMEGRACYSFCMCPGGHVVAAQSEANSIVTNGMSYHARDGKNANSAIVVSVEPKDFPSQTPLAGIAFQRQIEQFAYQMSNNYCAPCQRVGDFLEGKSSKNIGHVEPTYPLGVVLGNIESCFPTFVNLHLKNGLRVFERKMHGFSMADALLTAPETRTSSPVRLKRNHNLHSISLEGVIPCGEGAGYAGGIMSAAVDGIRAARQIMEEFSPKQ